jgi:hypothetical protein
MSTRREFITLLGGAAAAWPITAEAQQPGKLPTIGFLGSSTASATIGFGAFLQRLRELGWIEAAPSRSSIAGRMPARSASPRSQTSSSGLTSM